MCYTDVRLHVSYYAYIFQHMYVCTNKNQETLLLLRSHVGSVHIDRFSEIDLSHPQSEQPH